VRLAFVERTASFEKVAREAGTLAVAEGDLAEGAVLAFSLRPPDDALPNSTARYGRVGWELRARVDRAGPDPTVDRPIALLRSYTAPD
jgi:hypothetical protein